jgi:hypothetical protein
MHVMMAIDPRRRRPIQTAEFFKLSLHDVFEGAGKSRVKNYPMKRPPQQVRSDLLLALGEPDWTVRRRKPRCKVQMEAGIDLPIPSDRRSSLRIFHENHGTYRRDGPMSYTFKHPVGRFGIPPPIVAVDD